MESKEIHGRLENCQLCGNQFDSRDMLNFKGRWVCAGCKNRYVQMLREGVEIESAQLIARKGKFLIMSHKAKLPERCAKCNASTSGSKLAQTSFYFNLPSTRSSKVYFSLCLKHKFQRFLKLFSTIILMLFSFLLLAFSFESDLNYLAVFCLMFMIGLGICLARFNAYFSRYKIDSEHIWLKGFCKEFLDQLPEWYELTIFEIDLFVTHPVPSPQVQ